MRNRISRLSLELFCLDVVLTPVGLFLGMWLRSTLPIGKGGALPEEAVSLPWYIFLLAIICWCGALAMNAAYDPQRVLRWFNEARIVVASGTLGTILMAGGLYIGFREMSRLQFVYVYIINLGLLLGYRAALRVYYRLRGRARPGWRSRVLIIGAGDLGRRLATVLLDHSRWGYDLVGYVDDDPEKQGQRLEGSRVLGRLVDLVSVISARKVEELWIALPARAHQTISDVVAAAEQQPVRIKIAPDYFSMALVRAKAEILGGIPLIGLREPVIEGADRLIKRAFDLAVGGASILVAAFPMAVIALLIRLDSRGPVLFRQQRVGENGRPFDMLKFRTMDADAEQRQAHVLVTTADGQVIHKHKGDPRVTRIGRFLRRYSLDELPQLLNVLRGEMSLVGPRPEMPWLVDRYEPWQRKRFAVPQGITGWWQVNERSDKPMHLNTDDDLYYVYNYSLWLDLRILLMTPLAALRGRGAF
jgi:exopolysaccharide biosynthesis polyprenyl glycosylphosphotransferase